MRINSNRMEWRYYSNLIKGFRDGARARVQWNIDNVFFPSKALLFLGLKQRPDYGDWVQEPEERVTFSPRGCCWPPGNLFSGVVWRGGGGGRSRRGWRRGDVLTDIISSRSYDIITWSTQGP